jgi:uncharacterized protein (TIGR02118 family)
MIKLVFCLRRRPELSLAEFHKYWFERHAPMVQKFADTIGCKRYVQVHTTAPEYNEQLRIDRGAPEPYDGVAELWFDERDFVTPAFDADTVMQATQALIADEREFIDLSRSPLFFGIERPIID